MTDMSGIERARLFLVFLLVCAAGSAASGGVVAQPPADDLAFGTDAAAVTQDPRLWHLQYGTVWIGTWNLEKGWQGPTEQFVTMRDQGVVPVVHLYYWGDDLTPGCYEDGCWSTLHDAHKDRAGWHRLTEGLLARLNATMEGGRVIVLLEDEFNQIHAAGHDGFDRALADMARKVRAGYPSAEVVLPFGNWNKEAWATWDEAAAASDMIGIQALRGSTRHGPDAYAEVFETTLRGVERLRTLFGKPMVVHDVGLSSYPEPAFLRDQAEALQAFFEGLPELRAAGVDALMYRSFRDDPAADPANWFGEAERHWGLAWSGNGTLKPAGLVWLAGVKGGESDGPTEGAPPAGTNQGTDRTAVRQDHGEATVANAKADAEAHENGSGTSDTEGTARRGGSAAGATVGLWALGASVACLIVVALQRRLRR